MVVQINKRANNSIRKVVAWIDTENTEGAGDRWFDNLANELKHFANLKIKYPVCKAPDLAKFQYRCFTHKDKWVVAYKIENDKFVVYRFIYGPWLAY